MIPASQRKMIMTKPLRTLFVVADGLRARWVWRSEAADDFVTVSQLQAEAMPTGPPPDGVVFSSSTGLASGVSEHNSPARRHNARFANVIAEELNAQSARGEFERLAVVAPTRMLAPIRDGFSVATRAKLVKTLAKDLTKTPDHELGDWLRHLEFG